MPRTAAMALAAVISSLCIVLAGLAGLGAYAASQADTSAPEQRRHGLIGLGIALAILYMGIAVWGVPLRRWRIARFVGAMIPAGLGLAAAWTLLSDGGYFSLGVLTLSILALSYLVHPEIDRWLRRRRPPRVQR